MTSTHPGQVLPRPHPPRTFDDVTARWRATLEHITASGGLIIAVDTVHTRDRDSMVVLMATSDGDLGEHSYPASGGAYLATFQTWLAGRIEQLAAGRLVALLTVLPNWAGQGVAEIHPMAPHVVLPLRLAPKPMADALEAARQRILARPVMGPQQIGTDASRHVRKYGGTTWAWVSASGDFRTYRSDRQMSTNAAETLAILCAASSFAQDVPLHIVSDSKTAVAVVTSLIERSSTAEEVISRLRLPTSASVLGKRVYWAARELPLRPVQVEWVRGHDGHPLNEAANRLAILARRAGAAECSTEVYSSMCAGVVADLTSQLSD